MFTRFAEAGARRERRRGVTAVSVAAHAALAWLAAVATVRANPEPPPAAPDPNLVYHPPAPPTPPAEQSARRGPASPTGATPAPERTTSEQRQRIPYVDVVPATLPPIGEPGGDILSAAVTHGATAALGDDGGSLGGGGPVGGVWNPTQVGVEARARAGNEAPRYPAMLEQSGVEGQVVARFVVDTAGRVERGSVAIRTSDHPLFAEAVRRALARYRFEPARVGGRPVRQLVEQPFVFSTRR